VPNKPLIYCLKALKIKRSFKIVHNVNENSQLFDALK
jgi:hypothetical protein